MSIRRYLNVFGNTVPWYGICVAVALASMAICLYVSLKKRPTPDQDESAFLMTFPLMCVFGVIASISLDALFTGDWHTWLGDGECKFGLTFTGFLVGAIVFLFAYGRATHLGCHYLLNTFLPPLALAQSIGRVGCFLGGCCYGVPCAHGVCYPPGSLPFINAGDTPLLPIQLIEAGLLMCLAVLLLKTALAKRMYVYVVGASIIRFAVEFFRFDNRGTLGNISTISPQQFLSILLLVLFLSLFIFDRRRIRA